ncbi:hypothetical protein [Pseudomonas leptonychotis]|uniref:hypothetical protein n=1 Tax=Pseudomonas leptonychotis TaxID=2448482 RepID=UPI003863B986
MIEFVSAKPKPDGKRIHTQMRRDVEWLLIQGWQLERKADGVHLSLGAQKKIVRGGVLING